MTMRQVQLTMWAPAVEATEAFRRIGDFARYPDQVEVVRAVTVHPAAPGEPIPSDWEVYFRNGILRWSELDRVDPFARRIDFEQTAGDFADFRGHWLVRPHGGGCHVDFRAEFDFGIPSLAGILDPIAARVLRETIAQILAGVLDAVSEVDEPTVATIHRAPVVPHGETVA
jgi:ribosome-associated toxin RatA of RatAB toxin-antitoxin module